MLKQTDRRKQRQSGFTLTEVLLTVAIMICLLALSFVAITKYIRHIQITDLDNAAREIYMAAQNEAILLSSSGELEDLVIQTADAGADGIGTGTGVTETGTETGETGEGTGTGAAAVPAQNQMDGVEVTPHTTGSVQITAYYIASTDDEAIAKLLPKTSIENDLWSGKFYIVYEPVSGSVIDVFYAKSPDAFEMAESQGFKAFYDEWRAKPKEDRMNNNPMIGYYGGDSAESGNSLSLRTPVVNIFNEDVLRVEVTYWIPQTLRLINSTKPELSVNGGVELDVELAYDGKKIKLDPAKADETKTPQITTEYTAITYIWKLDSLEDGKQFKDLLQGKTDITSNERIEADSLAMGKDFTITASVSYSDEAEKTGFQVNGARKSATDNSLFAKGSGDKTAKIAYMRHLQNLDTEFSKVDGKNQAVQIADITCGSEHNFIPIMNEDLRSDNEDLPSYDGGKFHIKELHMDATEIPAENQRESYGLFGSVSGMTLSNIKMVNAQVNGRTKPTGTLVGSGSNMTIKNCGVYWENTSATEANLRSVLGDSDKGINYMITGEAAGGLAGEMKNSKITGSFAATTIDGDTAGGLVGRETGNLTITGSYGDNYLTGKQAAGLIGNLSDGSTVTINDAYAVGFIESSMKTETEKAKAAGFCLGNGMIKSTRAYSAMLFSENADNYALNPNTRGSEYTNTYYLDSTNIHEGEIEDKDKDYATLTNLDSNNMRNLYGTNHQFETKDVLNTNPYNLQTTLLLTSYSYPGLENMEHYGDWGAEFQSGSLVYYERYGNGDTNYAFDGGNLKMIKNDQYAVEDGYALAFRSSESGQLGLNVEVTYETSAEPKTVTLRYGNGSNAKYPMHKVTHTENGKTEEYFLLPLPGDMSEDASGENINIVNTAYASENFYQEISFSLGSGVKKVEGHYYYNPHFANAVVPYGEGIDPVELVAKNGAKIRTARHLNMLSKHEEYFSSCHPYKFKQEMDINYSIYEGYELFPKDGDIRVHFQTPIGNGKKPFKGTYDGDYHTIENVGVNPVGKNYIGLFGYSQGTIRNTTYLINEDTVGTITSQRLSGTVYIGGLAGYNGGLIRNCAVAGMEIDAYAYDFSTVQAGGLVGWNRGTIRDSSAALTDLTVETTLSNSYVGGFVGRNGEGGDIKKCYAVGCVNVEKSRYGNVVACGFAGTNKGSITKSYAAVDLQTSGGAKACGFCQDETSTSNYYMNEGNFSYNNVNYTAQYSDTLLGEEAVNKATAKKWSDFAEKNELSEKLGMSKPTKTKAYKKQNGEENYPYPGVVKSSKDEDAYIHYGMWPELMNLKQCGIYYWEKMEGLKNKPSYYLSAIIVNPNEKSIEKIDTLSTKHGDGGIVTEYGYGYFTPAVDNENKMTVTLTSQDVDYGYHSEGVTQPATWTEENTACNEALKKLLENKYDFHSYNTWDTDKTADQGLYLTSKTEPYGTWTLAFKSGTANEEKIDFNINPFFADSMSLTNEMTGWKVKDVSTTTPGAAEQTSFQVRSVDQLQFINWNVEEKNTRTVLNASNGGQFLFLGYKDNRGTDRKYFWKQTHDLQGEKDKNYTPIAELYDKTTGNEGTLYGWFGGTYDGDDYVIQDVNIEGQTSSCAGLFGMVYDGTLKNIIMYSPTGDGTVAAGDSKSETEGSTWYAIGGLAGFAATSSENQASAIENCAIAGYTIKDSHEGGGGWGGTCMGGLIGVSCMDLKNCTAVTELESSVQDNDNVRIGGLVGTSQRSISSCYAGGNIAATGATAAAGKSGADRRGIFIGGIVGGVYFKPLIGPDGQIGDPKGDHWIENALNNCYSYVTLPSAETEVEGVKYIKALYAVGGPGEITQGKSPITDSNLEDIGNTAYNNCYYLGDMVWRNNGGKAPIDRVRCDTLLKWFEGRSKYNVDYASYEPAWPNASDTIVNNQVISMSYTQMSDGTLLEALKPADFETVTTTSGGNTINGKYSFTSDPSLIGENYPFPTILTQMDKSSKEVNVHYGAWPIEGLSREHGSVPIDIDLFADYTADGAVKTEDIMLSSLVNTGGILECEVLDDEGKPLTDGVKPIVEAKIDAKAFNGEQRTTPLTLIGKQAGSAKVKVTYTVDNREYTTFVDVQVTAELQLLPQKRPVSMFIDETASVVLDVRNKNGRRIEGDLLEKIDLNEFSVELDNDYLSDAKVTKVGDKFQLRMTSKTTEGISKATLGYSYTYEGTPYEGTNPISVEIASPIIDLKPLDIYLEGAEKKSVTYGAEDGVDEKIDLTVNGQQPSAVTIDDFSNGESVGVVYAQWSGDKEKGILSIEGNKAGTSGVIRLKLNFTIEGVIHESWQQLQVNVHTGSKPTTP